MSLRAKKASRRARKTPRQSRSTETVAIIVEAAARVLEAKGLAGFNTNAVAERAGVSIGSIYQYFRNKDALLIALIERQAEPFLLALGSTAPEATFSVALAELIEASVKQQLERPAVARVLDSVEMQAGFEDAARKTLNRAQEALLALLARSGAPPIEDRVQAARDLMSLIRALTDAAGERGDTDAVGLVRRLHRTACGYLGIAPEL